jgi:hypothetical protein
LRTVYLDSPFASDMRAYGVTASYALTDDWTLGAELLRIDATALNGEPLEGGLISLALTKRFSQAPDSRQPPSPREAQWAASAPPIARTSPVTDSSLMRTPYQPP